MNKDRKIFIWIMVILVVCGSVAGFAILRLSGLYFEWSNSVSSNQYFLTVTEAKNNDNTVNKQIRISGVVIGDSIEFDKTSGKLTFQIADIPADYTEIEKQGGLAVVLENAVNDSNRQRIQVVYVGQKPELLRNMAQAIMVGKLHSDGIFYADEILLKCPSRYEEAVPDHAIN